MAGTKEIKRRIKSVKNTKKITKAMELVAASKMKRAVASTLASRLYAEYSWEILTSLANSTAEIQHSFWSEQEKGKILLVLITSNRGLCGAYNAQVIKKSIQKIKELTSDNQTIDIITVGKKGNIAMARTGQNVVSAFTELSDNISLSNIVPLAKHIIDEYKSVPAGDTSGQRVYKKVYVAYTDFISALTQKPHIKQLLPVSQRELKELLESLEEKTQTAEMKKKNGQKIDYLFEGDFNTLIESLAEKLTRMQIYQMLLESNASEQSSRMVAMKNASEASGEMIDDLTLVFNKARQSNITREISEISAGMASVS